MREYLKNVNFKITVNNIRRYCPNIDSQQRNGLFELSLEHTFLGASMNMMKSTDLIVFIYILSLCAEKKTNCITLHTQVLPKVLYTSQAKFAAKLNRMVFMGLIECERN
jgi:hypothetical protein